MKQDLLSGLTEEQIARIKECKSQEEILAFAKEQGIELNDEQLDAVSGGGCLSSDKCPTVEVITIHHSLQAVEHIVNAWNAVVPSKSINN